LYAGSAKSFAKANSVADVSISPNDVFSATLLTNPLKDLLKFTVSVNKQQSVQLMVVDASGRVLLSDQQTLSLGSNLFSYTTKEWTHGIYTVRIVSPSGTSSLKAVKQFFDKQALNLMLYKNNFHTDTDL